MTDRGVTHATFVLEHVYPVPPPRVFDAWADPAVKTRWFTDALDPAAAPMRMDFRVGGTEQAVSRADGGPLVVYEGVFRGIIPGERIVVANWIDVDGQRISVSSSLLSSVPKAPAPGSWSRSRAPTSTGTKVPTRALSASARS
jgi:uncharacterized protein YndB with AHSA1/START domain